MFSQPRALGQQCSLRFVELIVVPRQLLYIRQLQRCSLECWPLLLALIGHEPRLQHPLDCERCYSGEDQVIVVRIKSRGNQEAIKLSW
jgi:hypothetical protein